MDPDLKTIEIVFKLQSDAFRTHLKNVGRSVKKDDVEKLVHEHVGRLNQTVEMKFKGDQAEERRATSLTKTFADTIPAVISSSKTPARRARAEPTTPGFLPSSKRTRAPSPSPSLFVPKSETRRGAPGLLGRATSPTPSRPLVAASPRKAHRKLSKSKSTGGRRLEREATVSDRRANSREESMMSSPPSAKKPKYTGYDTLSYRPR